MGETSNGHVQWKDWFFDYGVFGTEGLSLIDGYFRGQKMFNKMSLPVIRVKYVKDETWGGLSSVPGGSAVVGEGCGPYNDQITWDTKDFGEDLNPIRGPHHLIEVNCPGGDRYICREEVILGGVPNLRMSIYARIGAYHIVQSWLLDNDGWIRPRIFSKGLSCNLDHWHHPYWRFDFALGTPETHRVAVNQQGGTKIADITKEGRLVNADFSQSPEYRITSTQAPDIGTIERPAEARVIPPKLNDAEGIVGPTVFSSLDGYVRKYRAEEDESWPYAEAQEMAFAVHDSCVDADIVFWSVCHLFHQASEGKDHWNSVGPDVLFRPLLLAALPPEAMRIVEVKGTIAVKDFGVVKDHWQHSNFYDQVLVNPAARDCEYVTKAQVGDVTAELIVHLTWNLDSSVNVHLTGRLFDELERVAEAKSQFNVLRDSGASGAGMHLVDYHAGDPDTADISLDIYNAEAP
ncbi:hypothetical protein [Streptomyces sp. NPDC086182]|jgi:hypothetical protein|uniref:hypothetical protein n=1 Tax=Streptomyces sp. NPDC086182 TaxID=3155058 RepID=UPI00343A3932